MSLCDETAMSTVCRLNPVTGAMDAASNVAGSALHGWWENVAKMAAQAHGKMVDITITWWVRIPTPTVSQDDGPVARIQEHLAWYMMLAAMVGLVIGAMRLTMARDGEQTLRDLGSGLLKWIFLSGAGTAAVALATQAGDAFSVWIIQRSAGGDLGAAMGPYIGLGVLVGPLGPFLVLILATIGLLSAFIQAALMFLRAAMLVLLAGTLPLAAAAGIGSTTGKQTLNKHLSWLVAFVLYKPVAAIVYASAFWMIGGGGDSDIVTHLSGLFMMIMAVAAMPALMRLITPAVSSLTTSAGAGAGAGAAAGTAAATGARLLSSGGSGGRGGGGGGQQQGTPQPGLASPGGASGTGGSAGRTQTASSPATTKAGGAAAAAGPVAAGITAAQTAGSTAKGATQTAAQHSTGEQNSSNNQDGGGATPGGAKKA